MSSLNRTLPEGQVLYTMGDFPRASPINAVNTYTLSKQSHEGLKDSDFPWSNNDPRFAGPAPAAKITVSR